MLKFTKKGNRGVSMSEQPFWFKATVTVVVVIGILALLTGVAFIQLFTIVGLVVMCASKGVLEWKKNRDLADHYFWSGCLTNRYFYQGIV